MCDKARYDIDMIYNKGSTALRCFLYAVAVEQAQAGSITQNKRPIIRSVFFLTGAANFKDMEKPNRSPAKRVRFGEEERRNE